MMRNVIAIFLNAKDANSDIIYSNFWSAKEDTGMKINEYQKLCMRTANFMDSSKPIVNGAMRLVGEKGEVIDLIKKCVFQGHELYQDDVVEELGDVL